MLLFHLQGLRLLFIVGLPLLVGLLFISFRIWHANPFLPFYNSSLTTYVKSVNSTLGFGRIYAVSKTGSSRRRRLIRASNVTELHITIPLQPNWTSHELDEFRLPEEDFKISNGSILAWLGHLHALRQFIESDDETALLLEDDVDWDVRLRSVQMPLLSSALGKLLPASVSAAYPYGKPDDWDLLYLGHCGDYWGPVSSDFKADHYKPEDLAETEHVAFADETMLDMRDLHPWTSSQLAHLGVAPKTRLLHRSKFPLCTFAYAVTRNSASRLLSDLAGRRMKDGPSAYDVAILDACRDKGLRCWTVNPELFHHVQGRSDIGDIDRSDHDPDFFKFMGPVDAAGRAQADERGETSNIGCGFWRGGFEFEDGDHGHLEWLRREYGRKGRCKEKAVNDQGSLLTTNSSGR
ncbi:hypothetical protein CP532_5900 [Ophiocordyceps camponoti-leonardi (nom. inval.)]|nr:hypothetical protein CP532_5900 [Ophiocordyceps camponoti-leonardi (nom. inval.)]